MSVKERDFEQFQQALKIYTDATCSQLDNLQYVSFFLPRRFCWSWCSRLKLLQFLPPPTDKITPLPSLSLCLVLFLAFPSRTCQTDHASSCTNFGRTVSPGWGRCGGPSWPIRFETWEFHCRTEILLSVSSCSPALFEALAALLRGRRQSHPFHPSFPSATCSRPSVRPSSAALSTRWKTQRWCPPCCSQVETSRLKINLTMHKISHESTLI